MENKENYMDDYDENPIIESDIKEIIKEFNGLAICKDLEIGFYVTRHELGDGKHRVYLDDENFNIDVDACTTRETFKKDLRDIMPDIAINIIMENITDGENLEIIRSILERNKFQLLK